MPTEQKQENNEVKVGEKTWEERFPKYTPGHSERGFGSKEFVESLRNKPIKTFYDMTDEERRQSQVTVLGNLDSNFSQEGFTFQVLLKPAGDSAPERKSGYMLLDLKNRKLSSIT